MQYLLTEEEFNDLSPMSEVVLRDHALAAARERLLEVAGFDCIHKPGGKNYDGYCSGCPCSPIGSDRDYATWSRVCWLPKEYSK